ncbi:hypothetical protein C1I98_26890 [Spongiactinospora gelatinilytica]|uniref:Uncharacterized protein n=1 Tax=Spongiactinospora gelatinilytica TaxID=2666298 RepID=A0A2W2G7Y1_9ACTN|nr:hypothetical protein [Spongiactinospora gelatinilytica]PZG36355.1 hypothetical protein C1I98_26890 [Spongiactinospora gelatinilytica]
MLITIAALALTAIPAPSLAVTDARASGSAAATAESAFWYVRTLQTRTHARQVGVTEKYWLVQQEESQEWADRDGRMWHAHRSLGWRPKSAADQAAWKRDGSPQQWSYRTEGMLVKLSTQRGKAVVRPVKGPVKGAGWWFNQRKLSFRDIQRLPATPKELKAWLAKASAEGADPVRAEDFDIWVKGAYTGLLYSMPAPKPVRAAAYKALSAMPGVQRARQGAGVERLAYALKDPKGQTAFTVDVDTRAMTLKRSTVATTHDGKPLPGKSWTMEHAAEWTDTPPPVAS